MFLFVNKYRSSRFFIIYLKVERTLHIHDHWDIQGAMTIRRFAVISAVTAPWYWHFQIKHVAFHNSILRGGSFAEPSKTRFRSRLRVTFNGFWYRIHCHVDYLLRYCDVLWRDLNKKLNLVIYKHKRIWKVCIIKF